MKQNVIIVGDSFCASPGGWPKKLADRLDLNLICHGSGGQSWWDARNFLTKLDQDQIDRTEFMIFAHSNADRIPSCNLYLGKVDHSRSPKTEVETAIHLYYKHIHDHKFLQWAQQQWFMEISREWGNKKLCHLHCFPWSLDSRHLLQGMHVTHNLMALSLNEIDAPQFSLINDDRPNHFNTHNNGEIASQLAEMLEFWDLTPREFDLSTFEQKTDKWWQLIS